MANTITTPNMNLTVPVVGVQIGPDYATNVNASLTTIDSHNHSTGQGVQITPAGLNINSDLTFNGNDAISLRSSRYAAQAAPLAGSAPDLDCVYVSGVDLYYNDGNGNQVRITQSGSVTGASGTITGLPSGTASASFSAGAFTFQSATSTPATMNVGPLVVGNSTLNSPTVTISPNAGIAANYNFTLPAALPAALNYMTLDASGNVSFNANGVVGSGAVTLATAPTFPTTIAVTGLATAAAGLKIGSVAAATGLTGNAYQYVGNKKNELLLADATGLGDAYFLGGAYWDGSNFKYATLNANGAYLGAHSSTLATTNVIDFNVFSSISHAADAIATPTVMGGVNGNGLWTIGATNGSQNHVINGETSIKTASGTGTFLELNNTTAAWKLDLPASNTALGFKGNGTSFGGISIGGLWTIGQAAGSQTHVVNGNLSVSGTVNGAAVFTEGTWTPTFSGLGGVSGVTLVGARYVRCFNTVICYLRVTLTYTTSGPLVNVNFSFTPPIAPTNNFVTNGAQGGGTVSWFGVTNNEQAGGDCYSVNGTKILTAESVVEVGTPGTSGIVTMSFQYIVNT